MNIYVNPTQRLPIGKPSHVDLPPMWARQNSPNNPPPDPCFTFSSMETEDLTCAFVLQETGLIGDRIDLE